MLPSVAKGWLKRYRVGQDTVQHLSQICFIQRRIQNKPVTRCNDHWGVFFASASLLLPRPPGSANSEHLIVHLCFCLWNKTKMLAVDKWKFTITIFSLFTQIVRLDQFVQTECLCNRFPALCLYGNRGDVLQESPLHSVWIWWSLIYG